MPTFPVPDGACGSGDGPAGADGAADAASGADASVGVGLAARVLRAVFDRAPSVPMSASATLTRSQLVAAAGWLRERAVLSVRTGRPPRRAFAAAVPLAEELHSTSCTAGLRCPAAAAAARVVELDVTGRPQEADVELGSALAAAPEETIAALAAMAAALVVVVDGPGAEAVIRAMTASAD